MPDFWVRRIGSYLHADGNESMVQLEKLPLNEPHQIIVRRPRNLAHHRLFWAVVHRIANGVGVDPELVCDVIKISSGHCRVVRSRRYGLLRFPRSISFANMDQTEFAAFFERALVVIFDEWGIERAAFADLIAAPDLERSENNKSA